MMLSLMNMKLEIKWNTSFPNGQPHRSLDISKAFHEFGFKPQIQFNEGLKEVINSVLKNQNSPY